MTHSSRRVDMVKMRLVENGNEVVLGNLPRVFQLIFAMRVVVSQIDRDALRATAGHSARRLTSTTSTSAPPFVNAISVRMAHETE